jgi:hypothetical protein
MLRWIMPSATAIFMIGSAAAADLPRSGPAVYVKAPPVEQESDVLFTPTDTVIRTIKPFFSGPVLPGRATLPGYYGSSHSYDYQGPYYGGSYDGRSYVSYWDRLPYACGIYGYC